MTGVRLDRFLASTAIALLLCAGGTAVAGSGDQDTPTATDNTSSVAGQPAIPPDTAADPAMQAAPASAADSTASDPAPANAAEPSDQPATAAEQPGTQPKVPSTAETPPANPTKSQAQRPMPVSGPTALSRKANFHPRNSL